MTQRLSIGEQIRNSAVRMGTGSIRLWIESNRLALAAAVQQANSQRGAELLLQLCETFPMAAVAINLAMGGSAQSAIDALAMFDPPLAAELEKNIPNFEKLQDYWRQGNHDKSRS